MLIERLQEWALAEGLCGLTFEENYQLGPEDALTVSEYDTVIFADAVKEAPTAFAFRPLTAAATITFTTHAMNPESVLALCAELYGKTPASYLLAITGCAWEPNAPLSPTAAQNLTAALAFLQPQLRSGRFMA